MIRFNQNLAKTLFGRKREDIIDQGFLVRARPWYPIPASPGSTMHVESEYSYPCWILPTPATIGMVWVRFEHRYVGDREQMLYAHELHLSECECRACKGDYPLFVWRPA